MRRMKRILAALRRPRLLLAAGLAAGALLARPPAAQRLTSLYFAPHAGPANPPVDPAHPCEEIAFPARDGSRLEGWWFPATAPRTGVALFVHGNGWNLEKQWRHAARLAPGGFDVLIFDYRGFGDSEGRVSRRHAREDLLSALDVAKARASAASVPVVVVGQSMGAALVLETLGAPGSSPGIAALVADAPFSSWSEIGAFHLVGLPWLRTPARWGLASMISATGREPVDCVRGGCAAPLLVIGGSKDLVTPPHMARAIAEASGAELLMLDGAGHPGSRTPEEEDRVIASEIAFLRDAVATR